MSSPKCVVGFFLLHGQSELSAEQTRRNVFTEPCLELLEPSGKAKKQGTAHCESSIPGSGRRTDTAPSEAFLTSFLPDVPGRPLVAVSKARSNGDMKDCRKYTTARTDKADGILQSPLGVSIRALEYRPS